MKKVFIVLVLILMLVGMSGCDINTTFNPMGREDYIIFEDENKTVRLEIVFISGGYGRLDVSKDNQISSFMVEYRITNEWIRVYIDNPDENVNGFGLRVSFEKINFFTLNYDVMYLREAGPATPRHEKLSGLDITLKRIYNQSANPLNYFYNSWSCEENKILFINDDLAMYHKNSIKGTIQEESVWISFDGDLFVIQSDDLTVKLAGWVSFDGLYIVLEQGGSYPNFPNIITLSFTPIY